jgi:hypothetical protein
MGKRKKLVGRGHVEGGGRREWRRFFLVEIERGSCAVRGEQTERAWASFAGSTCWHVPMDDHDDAVRTLVFKRSKETFKAATKIQFDDGLTSVELSSIICRISSLIRKPIMSYKLIL